METMETILTHHGLNRWTSRPYAVGGYDDATRRRDLLASMAARRAAETGSGLPGIARAALDVVACVLGCGVLAQLAAGILQHL